MKESNLWSKCQSETVPDQGASEGGPSPKDFLFVVGT